MKKLWCFWALSCILTGCVSQTDSNTTTVSTSASNTAFQREQPLTAIASTSTSVVAICEALDLDLVGVPESTLVPTPDRYKNATLIGSPMSPDMEILAHLNPDIVLSPVTLMSDLQPKYENAGLNYGFVNLKSVEGMYQSIHEMGILFDREENAQKLLEEFFLFRETFQNIGQGEEKPTVLLLMGLPGSYVVATEHSYCGNLIELAGGQNVYAGTDQEFLNINPEDMLQQDPDYILRTAHALPESVMEFFAEEFETNDIWKHFPAVQEGRVYDLPYELFGMSATFDYQDGVCHVAEIFYGKDFLS